MVLSRSSPTAPLSGIRVLSFGSFVAGNICTLMLAELGADVVKIESHDRPEALRSYDAPDQPPVFEPSGIRTTALFAGMTRSLRSACIDMTNGSGRRTFRRLAERADVVVENLGPGTMESWGCSFADLRADNPKLVMLSISGYGRSGPLAEFRAYASNINNFLGLTSAWAPDGIHFDFVAGTHGACAVAAALAEVDRGAPGVFVDMAQTETGAAILAPLYLDYLANGREWSAGPNEVPGSQFSGVIRCLGADAWVAIELEDARDWAVMCSFLERPDLHLGDAGPTPEMRESLREAIEEWAGAVSPFQATHKLQKLGVAVGPVQNSEDLWRDAQLRSREAFVEVCHPDLGCIEYPNAPNRMSRTPGGVRSRGPRLGEHTADVLREWLACSESDVEDLRTSAAVWLPGETGDSSPC
jgi:crotonobetainyl-CoA:carnitine CoA-transferase CaiB-like acyl-CoA transferase